MALNIESCSVEELCGLLGGSENLLIELRDRLRDWLKLQPHLPQDVPNQILEHFILGTKMSLEQAKRKLDMFYTMRRLVPELLANRDPRGAEFARLHKMMQTVYLPKLTPEKYRVCILRPIVDDYSQYSAWDGYKYAIMIDEMLMADNDSRSLGNIYIFDHLNITFGFAAKFTPAVIKKFEVTVTEAHAKRIKAFHNVNAAPFTDSLLALVKTVLKPKLAARIHVHCKGNYDSLHQYVPKSILPPEYGGIEQPMAELAELWRQKVDNKRNWFLEQDKIVVDERLRPGPSVNGDDLFGFSGSFRKQYVGLPKLSTEKYAISILRPISSDTTKFDPWALHQYMFMITDICMVECCCVGHVHVYDLSKITLSHIPKLTPTILK